MHSKIGGVTNSKEDNQLARLRQTSVSQTETDEVLMKFFKGLGESTRLRIVEALLEKERNVSELLGLIGVPQSNISNHLACLKWCGYITSRKEGTSIFYRITDERVRKIVNLAREIIADNAEQLYTCTRIKG
jgi:DNA-binding transcriptional ArsR family regulator